MAAKDREPIVRVKQPGKRERTKRERHDRIAMAARKLFAEQGYDATTLRQVAEQAGLGLGTLFNYISDKRDLIYLVFNREVDLVTDAALAAPRVWQSFPEKILGIVEHNYRLFGGEPVLSRILLSEVLQHTPGFHLTEHLAVRDRLIKGMEDVVASAQSSGEITSQESAAIIARQIFFSYSAALRWWLAGSEKPEWRSGLRDFAVMLRLQVTGLGLKLSAKHLSASKGTTSARSKRKMENVSTMNPAPKGVRKRRRAIKVVA